MKLILIAVLSLLLTGCMTSCQQPQLVEVKVIVPVPCQEPVPARPVMPTEGLALGQSVDVQGRHMRAEIDRREAYEIRLRTALENCRAPLEPSGL